MGKTERASSHWASREPSDFGGAERFKVVSILFTGTSSIRRGGPEIARLRPCGLRDTAERSLLPPRDVLLHREQAGHGRQTRERAWTGRWRTPKCRTPRKSLPVLWPGLAAAD